MYIMRRGERRGTKTFYQQQQRQESLKSFSGRERGPHRRRRRAQLIRTKGAARYNTQQHIIYIIYMEKVESCAAAAPIAYPVCVCVCV